MKKLISITLSMVIVLSISITSKVNAVTQTTEGIDISDLKEKYDLKTVKQAPEGVEPIKFDTIKEAEEYIKKIKLEEPINIDCGEVNLSLNKKAKAYGVEKYSQSVNGLCTINIEASTRYLYSASMAQNYYDACTGVNSFLTGIYFGNAWTQTSYAANIVNGGRTLNVTVNGKFDYYILIDTSLTAIAGKTATISCSFSNP